MSYTEEDLYRIVKMCASDDSKTKAVRERISFVETPIPGLKLLKAYAYDSERTKALRVLVESGKLWMDFPNIWGCLRLYAYDSERTSAIQVLTSCPSFSVGPEELVQCLQLYSYDSHRTKALNVLESRVNQVLSVQIEDRILKLYSYDLDRIRAMESLQVLRNAKSNSAESKKVSLTKKGDLSGKKSDSSSSSSTPNASSKEKDPELEQAIQESLESTDTKKKQKTDKTEIEYKEAVIQSLKTQIETMSKVALGPKQRRTNKTNVIVPDPLKETRKGEPECGICCDHTVDVLLIPCLHAKYCAPCAVEQVEKFGNTKCSVCNAEIVEVKYIYL